MNKPRTRKVSAKHLADVFNRDLPKVVAYRFSGRTFLDRGKNAGIYNI